MIKKSKKMISNNEMSKIFLVKEMRRRDLESRKVGRENKLIWLCLFKKTPAELHSGQFSIFLISGGRGRKP